MKNGGDGDTEHSEDECSEGSELLYLSGLQGNPVSKSDASSIYAAEIYVNTSTNGMWLTSISAEHMLI